MSEQLAGGIKVGSEGKHHRGERMAAGVIGDFLGDACRFRPFRQYLVDVGFGNQPSNTFSSSFASPRSGNHFTACPESGRKMGVVVFCITTEAATARRPATGLSISAHKRR